jgi:hypothetical protein
MAYPLPYYCRLAVLLLGAGVLTAAQPTPAQAAQRPSALIAGRVIDQSSRTPIPRARVVLLGTPHDTASDSVGHFAHDGLSAGTYLLQIRALGYGMATWVIRLKSDDVVDRDFEMSESELGLDTITALGRPGFMDRRMQDFERRRQEGRGVFITEEEIRHENAGTVSDLLRIAAGVQTTCNHAGCVARMTRAARGSCRPDYVLDGFPATFSTTANLPTVGIVGIEIYRSLSEIPSQFLKTGATCGAIIIWTRSAPSTLH